MVFKEVFQHVFAEALRLAVSDFSRKRRLGVDDDRLV
ncbi:hypothetical protein O205_13870 [Bacillus amyloliquefaciens EGD-AQ14]|nr:hypothetical protein O205_13870 [Bacillus amyloliquefaciens EGD-AQ14]